METQLVPYDLNMEVIEDLRKKYLDVTIPGGDKAAYEMVRGGLRQCKEIRLACDEWHKERTADIIKAHNHYNAEKKRVHGLIAPIESYLKMVRQKEDDRIESEKQAKIKAEKARIEKIEKAIGDINRLGMSLVGLKSDQLQALLDEAMAHDIDETTFEEFIDRARHTQESVIQAISQALEAQKKIEAEDEAREKEKKRLEAVQKEQEAKEKALKAEQDRINEEKRQAQLQIELARTTRLKAIGLQLKEEFFQYADTKVTAANVFMMSEIEFENFIDLVAPAIETAKKQEEQKKRDREEKEAAEKKRAEKEAKAEAERLRPDRERILEYLDNLAMMAIPDALSTDQMQRQLDYILEELRNLIEKWRERL